MDKLQGLLNSVSMFTQQALNFNHLILIIQIIIGTIAFIILINKYFDYLQKQKIEDREYTELIVKKLRIKRIALIVATLLVSAIILHNNFNNFLTMLSLFSIGIILATHGQIQNILVGILMKMELIGTAIKEGHIIRIQGHANNLKVLKIRIFKTYLLDLSSEEVISLQNTDLITKQTSHEPVKGLEAIEYILITKAENMEGLTKRIEGYFKEKIKKEELDFESLRDQIGVIKFKYNFFPKIKTRIRIKYHFIDKDNIEVKVLVKRVNYEYRKYNQEFEDLIVNVLNFKSKMD